MKAEMYIKIIFVIILGILINILAIEASEKNSLTVKILSGNTPLCNVEIKIAKIGEYSDKIEITQENIDNYYKYVIDNNLKTKCSVSDINGNAIFDNLDKGYYIVFVDKNEKYNIRPSILMISENISIKVKAEYIGGGDNVTNITVRKLWYDNDNKENTRPNVVEICVLLDGIEYKKTELNKDNDFKFKFVNLPKNRKYTIKEEEVKGYSAEYYYDGENVTIINRLNSNKSNSRNNVSNNRNDEKANNDIEANDNDDNVIADDSSIKVENSISVEKQWIGQGNYSSVKIYLIKGESILDECIVSENTNWKGKFYNKPVNNLYEVWEEKIDGWKAVYEGNTKNGFVIKNYSNSEIESKTQATTQELYETTSSTFTENKKEKIPQTGMLLWPIPFLIGGGFFVVILGIFLLRGKKDEK